MIKKIEALFARFETLIDSYKNHPVEQPPRELLPFYWYFVRQVWPLFLALLAVGLAAALIEVSLFAFLGEIVDLVRDASDPETFFDQHGTMLVWMGFVALIARPAVFFIHDLLVHQTLSPTFTNMIRWQATATCCARAWLSFKTTSPGGSPPRSSRPRARFEIARCRSPMRFGSW